MATAISASTPYITAAEFLSRNDFRVVGQLMSDANNTPMQADLEDSSTVEGGRLNTILLDASGKLELSTSIGGRYTPTDLQAMTGASASFLKRLVADIAIGMCYQRRPTLFPGPPPAQATEAATILNAIASGEMVFGLQENIDASHMELTTNTPAQVQTRNSMVVQMRGYFGLRGNQRDATAFNG